MSNILIKNVDCLTLTEPVKIIKKTNVGISDNLISFVGKIPAGFKHDEIIDGKNKLLMPGLINAHTHLAMSLFRNYAEDVDFWTWLNDKILPAEEKLNRENVYWGSILSIAEMIKSGTTSFADMYFFTEETAKAVEETGIRAMISRSVVSGENSDKKLKESLDIFDKYNNTADERITVCSAPHAIYSCDEIFLKEVIAESKKRNMQIHIHLSETEEEVNNCKTKHLMYPAEYLQNLGMFDLKTMVAHGVYLTDKEMDILKKYDVSVIHNPGSNLKLGNGIAPVVKMLKKGLNVALGTDGAASNNNLNMFEEIYLATVLQKGIMKNSIAIKGIDAIKMATVNGARAMSLNNIGTVEKGNIADLILIDTDKPHFYPKFDLISDLVYSSQAGDTDTVIVNGKILMKHGKLLTIDIERVYFEIEKQAEKLLK